MNNTIYRNFTRTKKKEKENQTYKNDMNLEYDPFVNLRACGQISSDSFSISASDEMDPHKYANFI